MFSYTKVLPLALLISIPVLAMDKQMDKQVALPEELSSTILVRSNLAAAQEDLDTIKKEKATLAAREKTALANRDSRAVALEKKYNAKVTEIAGIAAILKNRETDITKAHAERNKALDDLKKDYEATRSKIEKQIDQLSYDNKQLLTRFEQDQTAKETEYDKTINALAALKLKDESFMTAAKSARDQIHEQLTAARTSNAEPSIWERWFGAGN